MLKLERGDAVRIYSPGGGGYGRPNDRAPEKVLSDVTNGFVTDAVAESMYGVILCNGVVDEARTKVARARMIDGIEQEFSFGKERMVYEETLPLRFQDVVADLLSDRPAPVRQYARGKLYGMVEKDRSILKLPSDDLGTFLRNELERVLSTGVAAVAVA